MLLNKFTIPADTWDEREPDKNMVLHLIQKHITHVPELQKLFDYYTGKHPILDDNDKTNKLVCNHAADIVQTASAYFLGNPISYKGKNDADISALTDALAAAGADEADGDNGLALSVFGRAYEYIYTKPGETDLVIKTLDPRNTFMVYDDSIEENELFAVYYYERKDDSDKTQVHYIATVLTQNYKWVLDIQTGDVDQRTTEQPEAHFKGAVPIVEYLNNKLAIGDFEMQISLIDAYNALMSDRVTDKEQYIDAILAIYGTLLSDDEYTDEAGETHDGGERAMAQLKRKKLLELPDGTKAEYLTRTYDESGVEILKKAIEQDIHKFSHVPCMTDEAFGGNVSGVAMEFKLLGLENITKIKTRYYREGLRKRLQIFANFYGRRAIAIDPSQITAVFTRSLPKNLLELSQIIANLWGKVSRKTLLSQIPFVEDPDAEIEVVDKESEEEILRQQALFQGDPTAQVPTGVNPDEDDEETQEEKPKKEDKATEA